MDRIVAAARLTWTRLNERLLNISTLDATEQGERPGGWRGRSDAECEHRDNHAYATPDYYYVRKIVNRLAPRDSDVVYDIGSGMGRFLCVMGRKKVKKCVGLEVLPELCEASRANAARLRGRQSPIEIRCEDASRADVSDGTIYFLFNPFGPKTMADVLSNIEASLARNPRPLQIVSYNDRCRDVFEARSWLRPAYSFSTWNGLSVRFYHAAGPISLCDAVVRSPDVKRTKSSSEKAAG